MPNKCTIQFTIYLFCKKKNLKKFNLITIYYIGIQFLQLY